MMEFYPREQWGAAPPTGPISQASYPETELFVHHEGGAVFTSLDAAQEQLKMRTLQKGMQHAGYSDFAYSVSVFPSGRLYEGRDLALEDGATYGHNETAMSLLFVGNYDTQSPSRQALLSAAWVVQLAQYLGLLAPTAQILGHRDVRPTQCPGNRLYRALPDLRALVRIQTPDSEEDDMPLNDDDRAWIRRIVHEEVLKLWRAEEMVNHDVARAQKGAHQAVVNIMRSPEFQHIIREAAKEG